MPLINDDLPVEDGQFDDAPEEAPAEPAQPATDPRAGHHYIDDEHYVSSDSEDDEDDEELDEFDLEEDALEDAAFDGLRAEDEDWEIAERGTSPPPSQQSRETNVSDQTLQNSITAYASTSPCAPGRRRACRRRSTGRPPSRPSPP